MKKTCLAIWLVCLAVLFTSGVAQAAPSGDWWDQTYSWCPDPLDDHVGNNNYSVQGIGYAIVEGYLVVKVDTYSFDIPTGPLPPEGGYDTYSPTTFTRFSPGDLYINVGGMFQDGDGKVWGIGTYSHNTDLTTDPNDGPWTANVTAGSLWEDAAFATGTLEDYQIQSNGTPTPDDGDGDDMTNSYPTLIMSGNQVAGADSGFHYDAASRDYYYFVKLSELGFTSGYLTTSIQMTWAMECGNDLVECKVVPEPTTVALISAGVAAMAHRKRRRQV